MSRLLRGRCKNVRENIFHVCLCMFLLCKRRKGVCVKNGFVCVCMSYVRTHHFQDLHHKPGSAVFVQDLAARQ